MKAQAVLDSRLKYIIHNEKMISRYSLFFFSCKKLERIRSANLIIQTIH